jgi:uncharacterized protein DUF6868
MPELTQTDDLLDAIAKVLLRCWILGSILLLFWFGVVMLAGDLFYGVHGSMFGLPRPQLEVVNYCGMGLTKLVVGLFFFIPWVSIWLVLKKRRA